MPAHVVLRFLFKIISPSLCNLLSRKAKKEVASTTDADQLAENLAKMSLLPDNNRSRKKATTTTTNATAKQQAPPLSDLELLEMERNRFVFQDVTSRNNGSDVVQETMNVLPEG